MDKNYVIVHGQLYAVPNKSNELKHWKYVKREKINGRWVYTYDDSEVKKAQAQKDTANANFRKAEDRADRNKVNVRGSSTVLNSPQIAMNFTEAEKHAEIKKQYNKAKTALDEATKKLNKVSLLHKTLIKPIAKGMAAVGNYWSSLPFSYGRSIKVRR